MASIPDSLPFSKALILFCSSIVCSRSSIAASNVPSAFFSFVLGFVSSLYKARLSSASFMAVSAAFQAALSSTAASFASSSFFFLSLTCTNVVPPSEIVSSIFSTSVFFKLIATCSAYVISDFVSIL